MFQGFQVLRVLYCHGPMFQESCVLRVLFFKDPTFQGSYILRALCSQGPMVQATYVPTVLCSQGPKLQRSYVPLFQGSYVLYVPIFLCFKDPMFSMSKCSFVSRILCPKESLFEDHVFSGSHVFQANIL